MCAVQEVTPWDVKGGVDGKIDYEKLSRDVSAVSSGSIAVPPMQIFTICDLNRSLGAPS